VYNLYKGKEGGLKGHFHISTQELYNVVVKAEKATKRQAKKKGKGKGRAVLYKAESEENIEEEARDESESETEDCIIVDVE
jgi:predicted signal transduction protein with EAL and GGDEF domain